MALFRGIQEYIALDANNITLVFDSGNIVNISGNIFLYPPQGHPILYKYYPPPHPQNIPQPPRHLTFFDRSWHQFIAESVEISFFEIFSYIVNFCS